MLPVGIRNASTRKVRIRRNSEKAMTMDLVHSHAHRATPTLRVVSFALDFGSLVRSADDRRISRLTATFNPKRTISLCQTAPTCKGGLAGLNMGPLRRCRSAPAAVCRRSPRTAPWFPNKIRRLPSHPRGARCLSFLPRRTGGEPRRRWWAR
jgi:hypothetical protein